MEELKTPERYVKGEVECWDYLSDNGYPYLLGCAVKYVWRFKDKGGLEDLKKAWYYLNKVKSSPESVRVDKFSAFTLSIASSVGISLVPQLVEYGENAFDWMTDEQLAVIQALHRLREPQEEPEFLHLLYLAFVALNKLASVEYKVNLESLV